MIIFIVTFEMDGIFNPLSLSLLSSGEIYIFEPQGQTEKEKSTA